MYSREREIRPEDLSISEPSWRDLESAKDDNPFMHAAIELLKASVSLISRLAGVVPATPLDLHAAIRCGLLVRSSKLACDMLADACNGRGRIQLGLSRQLLETLANVVYLCDDDDQGTRHLSFLHDSLIAEKQFLETIERRRRSSGDEEWPIEKRIRRSIERTCSAWVVRACLDRQDVVGVTGLRGVRDRAAASVL